MPITVLGMKDAVDKSYTARSRRYPCTSNRASELGFPCLRKRVYEYTRWEDKALFEVDALIRMEEGNIHEEAIKKRLELAGFKITSQQTPFRWDKYNINGKIDGKIFEEETRKEYPIEIKAVAGYGWLKLETIDDFKNSDDWWTRGYYAQVQIYLLMTNSEKGFFIIKNRDNGRLKYIEVGLDYPFAEDILKNVEKVNEYLKNKETPPKMNEPSVCPRCPFVQICMPEYQSAGVEFIDDVNLLTDLRRMEEIRDTVSEFNSIDKKLKEALKGKQLSVGEFLVTGKWIDKKPVPAQPAIKYWQRKVTKLDDKGVAIET